MNEQQIPIQQKPIADDEIDLLALAKTIWNGRKTIVLSVLIGTILGLVISLSTPNEYTASTVIVSLLGNEGSSKMGGLGGLAALAGINLDMNQGAELPPVIYPQILGSVTFQLEMMNAPLNFKDHPTPMSLFDYYTTKSKPSFLGILKKYTIGLPGVLIGAIKGKPEKLVLPGDSTNHPISLTPDQLIVQKALVNLISLDLNVKEGYITLTARMPEALAAAQLVQKAQALLQRYITEFRIEKTKSDLAFILGRYNENKAEFEKAQVSLAIINDKNKNFTSGIPRIETDRIQTRYTIAFSVFQELAKQLEQAKIQVKKETPAFAIIKPVTVPSEKSKPNRPMILFIWIFLGGVIGTGIVFGRGFFHQIKKNWNESETFPGNRN